MVFVLMQLVMQHPTANKFIFAVLLGWICPRFVMTRSTVSCHSELVNIGITVVATRNQIDIPSMEEYNIIGRDKEFDG